MGFIRFESTRRFYLTSGACAIQHSGSGRIKKYANSCTRGGKSPGAAPDDGRQALQKRDDNLLLDIATQGWQTPKSLVTLVASHTSVLSDLFDLAFLPCNVIRSPGLMFAVSPDSA
jgi:hypothetical protein